MNYYKKLFPNVKKIIVSDYCPNEPFQSPEYWGWKEVSKENINHTKLVWYRRSTSMGKSRAYVPIQPSPCIFENKIAMEIENA